MGEVFFSPEIFRPEFPSPLSQVVDEVIVSSPIDCRRPLYNNIVLSGGSTMFKDFGKRLQRDIKRLVDGRLKRNMQKMGITRAEDKPRSIKVDVASHTAKMQRYAVWLGGSIMASHPEFYKVAHQGRLRRTRTAHRALQCRIQRGHVVQIDVYPIIFDGIWSRHSHIACFQSYFATQSPLLGYI